MPKTFKEAASSIEWTGAATSEMVSLEATGTWSICLLPPGKHPIGCKWVFTIKYNLDGSLERYKARLVAKGYTQYNKLYISLYFLSLVHRSHSSFLDSNMVLEM